MTSQGLALTPDQGPGAAYVVRPWCPVNPQLSLSSVELISQKHEITCVSPTCRAFSGLLFGGQPVALGLGCTLESWGESLKPFPGPHPGHSDSMGVGCDLGPRVFKVCQMIVVCSQAGEPLTGTVFPLVGNLRPCLRPIVAGSRLARQTQLLLVSHCLLGQVSSLDCRGGF